MYRLENYLQKADEDEIMIEGEVHYIEGCLDNYVIISVPETTSQASAEKIKQEAIKLLNKPVCVITHNIAFVKAVKLSPKEAAAVIKRGEDYAEKASKIDNALSANNPDESGNSDGDRPGVCCDGGCDSCSPGVDESGSIDSGRIGIEKG